MIVSGRLGDVVTRIMGDLCLGGLYLCRLTPYMLCVSLCGFPVKWGSCYWISGPREVWLASLLR